MPLAALPISLSAGLGPVSFYPQKVNLPAQVVHEESTQSRERGARGELMNDSRMIGST